MKVRCDVDCFKNVLEGKIYDATIDSSKFYKVEISNGRHGIYSKKYFTEIKELTLLGKVMEHLDVVEGEKFNVINPKNRKPNSFSPYYFTEFDLKNENEYSDVSVLGEIMVGYYKIEKIPQKTERDIAIENAKKLIKDAHAELEKAEQMK